MDITEKKIEIFCCFAREDRGHLLTLHKHLRLLERQGIITLWSDSDINAGMEVEKEIDEHLNSAQLILLFVSPDFMQSDDCYNTMMRAMKRHEDGEARVIPIILRHTSWQTSPFAKLQALPRNAQPIVSSSWQILDEAFLDVVKGIEKNIEQLSAQLVTPASPLKSTTATPINLEDAHTIATTVQQKPFKKYALLDRRLVTELILLFSQPTQTQTIDLRAKSLLGYAFGLFEQFLVEKMYASTLWRLLSAGEKLFKEKFTFIETLTEDEDKEYALAVKDATIIWTKHPQFQFVVSQYDRLKGSNIGDVRTNVAYLDTTLRLARQLDAAIIPHPDRWTLYNWWFEECLWVTVSETLGKSTVQVPETFFNHSLELPEGEKLTESKTPSQPMAVAIARYGPLSYPFPKGILSRRYTLEKLATFEPFLYEFVVPLEQEEMRKA